MAGAERRAPRLGPGERLAPHITRVGRFRQRDPSVTRRPPGLSRLVGAFAWALLVEESLRRARARVRAVTDDSRTLEANPAE